MNSSRKLMRQLYTKKQVKCRSCEQALEDRRLHVVSEGSVRRPKRKVPPLFHPRECNPRTHRAHKSSNEANRGRGIQQNFDIYEEILKAARLKDRFLYLCRTEEHTSENVRSILRQLDAQIDKICEYIMRNGTRIDNAREVITMFTI